MARERTRKEIDDRAKADREGYSKVWKGPKTKKNTPKKLSVREHREMMGKLKK